MQKKYLDIHKQVYHESKNLVCQYCYKIFKNQQDFEEDLKRHDVLLRMTLPVQNVRKL